MSAAGILLVALLQPPSPAEGPDPGQSIRIKSVHIRDRIESDGSNERVLTMRAHLLDAMAVQAFGQIGQAYIEGFGDVHFDKIEIVKSDGRRVRVDNGVVEDINPYGTGVAGVSSDIRVKKYTIPGLEPGDSLEYVVRTQTKPVFPGRLFGTFEFTFREFADEEIYELDQPVALELHLSLDASLDLAWETLPSTPGRRVRRVTRTRKATPVPSAAPQSAEKEDGKPESRRRRAVLYSNFKSWSEVGQWWWDMSAAAFEPNDAIRAEARRLVEGKKTSRERVEALTTFVAERVRYLNAAFGVGRMKPRPAADVFSARYGDCKDKYALLAAMGKAVGIEFSPAFVESGPFSIDEEVPSPGQFNHLIAVTSLSSDAKDSLWVDPTVPGAPPGFLHSEIRDKAALVVGPRETRFITAPLELPFRTFLDVSLEANIDPSGRVRLHAVMENRSDFEPTLRMSFRITPKERWGELRSSVTPEWTTWASNVRLASDVERLDEPIRIEYDVGWDLDSGTTAKPWTFWIASPETHLFDAWKEPVDGTVFQYPGSLEKMSRARIKLPAGMKGRPPLGIKLERPFASYTSAYAVEDGALVVERRLLIHQRKIRVEDQASYESFRNAVAADRDQKFAMEPFVAPTVGTQAGKAVPSAKELNHQGYEALERGDAKQAEGLFRTATELDPQQPDAWNNLGRALKQLGRQEEALKAFDRQIEINAFDIYAYNNRGDLLVQTNRVAEGERDLLKQIEVAPFEVHAYRNLGHLRLQQNRFAEAADFYEKAVRIEDDHAGTWSSLAFASAKAGRKDEAVQAALRTMDVAEDAADKIPALYPLQLAGALSKTEPRLKGLSADTEAKLDGIGVETLDRDAERATHALVWLWYFLGEAAKERGDMAEARRYLTAAWGLSWNPECGFALANVLTAHDRPDDAIDIAAQVIALDPKSPHAHVSAMSSSGGVEMLKTEGNAKLLKTRTVTVTSPATADFEGRVRLLVDKTGRVIAVNDTSNENKLPSAIARDLASARVPFSGLETTTKVVRPAAVSCRKGSPCTVVLDFLHY